MRMYRGNWCPTASAKTAMSPSLPPEILDLIIDHLHIERATLEACCLVSKSWIPRTQRHLFAEVAFGRNTLDSWMTAFPNPSNSPARHTRTLSISGARQLASSSTYVWGWVRSFCRITNLLVETAWWDDRRVSLAHLHGLSPTLKSLCFDRSFLPLSEIFDLIHSFPLLEDLAVRTHDRSIDDTRDTKGTPATSPKFTGTLRLKNTIPPVVCRLLDLPGGLHFTKIVVGCPARDATSAMDLVSRCSGTLESLSLEYFLGCMFYSVPLVDGSLIAIHESRSNARGSAAT